MLTPLPVSPFFFPTHSDCGQWDQRELVESRADVISFTSDVFADNTVIVGQVSATLYVSSSANDTDFTYAEARRRNGQAMEGTKGTATEGTGDGRDLRPKGQAAKGTGDARKRRWKGQATEGTAEEMTAKGQRRREGEGRDSDGRKIRRRDSDEWGRVSGERTAHPLPVGPPAPCE